MSARRPRRAFDWSAAVIATLAITSAIVVFVRDGQTRFLAILNDDVFLFGTMLPKVLAGCLIGAFVTLLLPRETIARWVGAESGIAGILVATLGGAILPGGPFTIYPVAGAFLAAGADAGAACAFVISWTLLGYTRAIVWELPVVGLGFVPWRIILSLPLAVLPGVGARARWRVVGRAAACAGVRDSRDAGPRGVAARRGFAAAAVSRRMGRDGGGQAVTPSSS